MAAGLVVSQALTLLTIPVTYLYMERFSEWLGRFTRPRRRAPDHALVPAGNHPRPVIVHEHFCD
ncbi:MAG: hypothetical protein WA633_21095 [Stellaceae bacterium]